MLTESERRAAKLAVSRYGANQDGVQKVFVSVLQAQAKGQQADLLESLVRERLLTPSQADELRASLDSTHVDLARQAAPDGKPATPEPRALGGYRVLRKLGEGGMGSVFLAYDEKESRQVAIKVLADNLASSQPYIDRFYREAQNGGLLNHPNIVRNLAAGRDQAGGRHYLVMEYVDGPSAHQLMERHGRLPVGDAVHIALDVARALEHAHSRNIVHRDIKPDNILLTRSGLAKLVDLGLAKRTDENSHLTATRQGFGTPYYMPYEQAMNAKYADARSDIYALGATLYHLVTGELPFPGVNHVEIVEKKNVGLYPPASSANAEVPALLDAILVKMLARGPEERYQTASELIVDLERSGLAAAMPSFADPDLALQDPVVRKRLTAPAAPTMPDLNAKAPEAPAPAPAPARPDIWFVRYRNPRGQWCKTKATTDQILKRLREGRIPADAEACHEFQGEFRPLGQFDEFRAAAPARKPRAPGRNGQAAPPQARRAAAPARRWRLLLWCGLAVGGLVALTLLALALLPT